MPSMGGSATLVSAPRYGDLTNVDITGQVDHQPFAWDATAGRYKPLPGVVGDGAQGLMVAKTLAVDTPTGLDPTQWTILDPILRVARIADPTTDPGYVSVEGNLSVASQQGDYLDTDYALEVAQNAALTGVALPSASVLHRTITRNSHLITSPVVQVFVENDGGSGGATPAAGEPVWQANSRLNAGIQSNAVGGLGVFGTTPPTAKPAITGALSTVADAPAKAVLTSIIAALTGCGLASNGTT